MNKVVDRQKIKQILDFWFQNVDVNQTLGNLTTKWWQGGQVDIDIQNFFKKDIELAHQGEYEDWKTDRDGYLAYIVLNDQFPRNCFRKTGLAFRNDILALKAAEEVIAKPEIYQQYKMGEKYFILLPLCHAESLDYSTRFKELYDEMIVDGEKQGSPLAKLYKQMQIWQKKHYDIIQQFGRYPYRNKVMGRESTQEEEEWLKNGGETFGQ